jgi:hypothetical protein
MSASFRCQPTQRRELINRFPPQVREVAESLIENLGADSHDLYDGLINVLAAHTVQMEDRIQVLMKARLRRECILMCAFFLIISTGLGISFMTAVRLTGQEHLVERHTLEKHMIFRDLPLDTERIKDSEGNEWLRFPTAKYGRAVNEKDWIWIGLF